MLKIVLDTNIFIAAFIFNGMTRKLIDLVLEDTVELYISPELKKEIFKKLYEFQANNNILQEVTDVLNYSELLLPEIKITICRDPKDNYLLELAEVSEAAYLITRDKDLLDLPHGKWKNTVITKPEDFLPLLRKMHLLE